MNTGHALELLLAETAKNRLVLDKIHTFLLATESGELVRTGKTPAAAIMMAGILENYYTCLETLFLKISQTFENHLPPEKWHMELLSKMALRVPGLREPLITDDTRMQLLELLRFRHFKRYYFEFEFDWPKIDFLIGRLKNVHPMVLSDIDRFSAYLQSANSR